MEYSNLVEKVDDMDSRADDDYEALCSWILEPCFPYFREFTATLPHLRSVLLSTNPSREAHGLRVFPSRQGHSKLSHFQPFRSDDPISRPSAIPTNL